MRLPKIFFFTTLSFLTTLTLAVSPAWVLATCSMHGCAADIRSMSSNWSTGEPVYTVHRCMNCKGPWENPTIQRTRRQPPSADLQLLATYFLQAEKAPRNSHDNFHYRVASVKKEQAQRDCLVSGDKAKIAYLLRVIRKSGGPSIKFHLTAENFPKYITDKFSGVPAPESTDPYATLYKEVTTDGDLIIIETRAIDLSLGTTSVDVHEYFGKMKDSILAAARCPATNPFWGKSCSVEGTNIFLDVFCKKGPEDKTENLLLEKLNLLVERYQRNAKDKAKIAVDQFFSTLDQAVTLSSVTAVRKHIQNDKSAGYCMMHILESIYNYLPEMIIGPDDIPNFGIKHSDIDKAFIQLNGHSKIKPEPPQPTTIPTNTIPSPLWPGQLFQPQGYSSSFQNTLTSQLPYPHLYSHIPMANTQQSYYSLKAPTPPTKRQYVPQRFTNPYNIPFQSAYPPDTRRIPAGWRVLQ